MVYQFRESIRFPLKVTAQEVGESLEAVTKERGELTPRNLVEVASDEKHILHECFEWNDQRAAVLYREKQARHVIGSVYIVVGEQKPPTRAFVNVVSSETRQYVPIQMALRTASLKEQVLAKAKRELDTFHHKYSALKELCDLYVDKIVEMVGSKEQTFYATFSDDTRYSHYYVLIKAASPQHALQAMNTVYGKDDWDEIFTEEEFGDTKDRLTKLREIDLFAGSRASV